MLNVEKSNSKTYFKCPNCQFQFIPESIYLDKLVDIDKAPDKSAIVEENGRKWIKWYNKLSIFNDIKMYDIKPNKLIIARWIITCPECSYISKFAAQAAVKTPSEDDVGIPEFNKKFKYFIQSYSKPCLDYSDYYSEFINSIKNKIAIAFKEVMIEEWSRIFSDWKSQNIDSFKFAVRLISNMENYYKANYSEINKKEMPEKIKEFNLPNDLQDKLINLNHLRNKAVHDGYELNQDKISNFSDGFLEFIEHLLVKQLKPLRLNEIKIPEDIKFLDLDYVKREVWLFIYQYLDNLKFNSLKSRFSYSVLESLNIEKI